MDKKHINSIIRPFIKPSNKRAIFQITNTVIPYILLITIMYFMLRGEIHYAFVLLLSIVPALFLVRIFILFHDCTHSSFVESRFAMTVIGTIFGILVFTPYKIWKEEHRTHHRTVGNIDKRGTGDVWTMTVKEYRASSKLRRFGYLLYRNPIVLFVIGPLYIFIIRERFPRRNMTKELWIDLIINNIGVIGIMFLVSFTLGFKYYLMIQLPIIYIAATLGVWLFYVQHQYEEVYWEDNSNWSVVEAALRGSSVYRLPGILNWFTGSIGYHNIHHLNARIPNYRLKKLFKSSDAFGESKQIRLLESLKLAKLFLYDEESKRLISYRKYRKIFT